MKESLLDVYSNLMKESLPNGQKNSMKQSLLNGQNNLIKESLLNGKYEILQEIQRKPLSKKQVFYLNQQKNIAPKNLIAINQNTQQKVFIKRLGINRNEYEQQFFDNELKIYKSIRSRNVVQYIEDFQDEQFRYLVLEYFEYSNHGQESKMALNLEQYLDQRVADEKGRSGIVSEIEAISIIKQILNGFRAIHQNLYLLHKNMALDNFLISEQGQIKIIGFSLCSILETIELHSSIKEPFRQQHISITAPEILAQRSLYYLASDIYSIGAIFHKLIFGRYPFQLDQYEFELSDNIEDILDNVKDNLLQFDPEIQIQDETKSIIRQMLRENPKERISFKDLNQCELFKIKYQINNNNTLVSFANQLDLMKDSIVYDNEAELERQYQKKQKDLMIESQKEKQKRITKMLTLTRSQEKEEEYRQLERYTRRINHIEFICYTIEEIYKTKLRSRSITLLSFLLIIKVIQAAEYLSQKLLAISESITIPDYKKQIQECLIYLQQDIIKYQLEEFRDYGVRIYGEQEISKLEKMNEDEFNNYFKKIVLEHINKTKRYKKVHVHILQCCIARYHNRRMIEMQVGQLIDEFQDNTQPSQEEIQELINQIN